LCNKLEGYEIPFVSEAIAVLASGRASVVVEFIELQACSDLLNKAIEEALSISGQRGDGCDDTVGVELELDYIFEVFALQRATDSFIDLLQPIHERDLDLGAFDLFLERGEEYVVASGGKVLFHYRFL
jgi:hypothetical protein